MKTSIIKYCILLFIIRLTPIYGQDYSASQKRRAEEVLNYIIQEEVSVGRVRIDTIFNQEGKTILQLSENFSYFPFRENRVKHIYTSVANALGSKNEIKLITSSQPIESLVPKAHRSKRERKEINFTHKVTKPLVNHSTALHTPTKGLKNRHIALWQSHGYYYEPKLTRWEWQRARIFQTVEDLYTQSYVLPFLVPMLESAGANVLMPRERDTQIHEIIIDNDANHTELANYREFEGDKSWSTGSKQGFADNKDFYIDKENPFRMGTYRETETIKKGKPTLAQWIPNIPKDGEYAVYVSYKSLPNSTEEAKYTVYHNGNESSYEVNQTMGGGTWIYLGTFNFKKGLNQENKVVLTNISSKKGKLITADAIKIGGGYGNIARTISDKGVSNNTKSSTTALSTTQQNSENSIYPYEISGYPRFTEAARYWLQWAGIPDSIYTPSEGVNDYTDDYQSRGLWVNYLTGGTKANPESEGLNIPIDLAFAFHTDAGTTFNDSIIGTLGIFRTSAYNGKYENGSSRYTARDLTDLIQSQIVDDIRSLYHPEWTRRGMWDRAYSEASTPKVPTMLLELLSHQNFADMQFGLDPRFRFTVSRSIYKGILKHISAQYNSPYIVQPLPVESFRASFTSNNEVELNWQEVEDVLEPTAKPSAYVVYTRIGINNSFNNGTIVKNTSFKTSVPTGAVCSFKVTALNEGGESFPSEILSVGRSQNSDKEVLIINGFTRVSAPDDFDLQADSIAGFLDEFDHGVPYIKDISYIGKMKEFRRTIPWMDDDASGFGDSYGDHETEVIAGNSFDYPALHGESILKAGYSFVSTSKMAVENNEVNLTSYPIIDLILGKEKQSKMGSINNSKREFKTFSKSLQKAITNFCNSGGSILVSGAYIASDLWDNPLAKTDEEDLTFAQEILKYKWRVGRAAKTGGVKEVASPYSLQKMRFNYNKDFNSEIYRVESPDAIEPVDKLSHTVLRYSENNLSAAVAYKDNYRTYIIGFPFETITETNRRDELMKTILDFFTK